MYFSKNNSTYWNDNYGLWEKAGVYHNQFDKNPFYTLNFTDDFIKDKENFLLNKQTVTAKLIEYIDKGAHSDQKAYYNFLVANCYYNMTIYGNAWMMRRFGVSAYDVEPFPEDEAEFRNAYLAKKYYQLAYENATNDKFKALSLRMMAKCRSFEIESENPVSLYNEKSKTYWEYTYELNELYQILEEEYPDYTDHLRFSSNCLAFEEYFKIHK